MCAEFVMTSALSAATSGTTLSGAGQRRRLHQLGQDLVLRTERLLTALLHHQQEIDAGDRARPMRDDDDDAAARATREDRLGQGFVAFGIEIGIRLVEHDQERIAVERARQRDALRLTGRERSPLLADLGLVAFGQTDDELVHAGGLGGGDDGLGVGLGLEAGDVLRHRAGQQLDVLRQIADVAPSASDDHWSSAAPSRRTLPRTGCQTPTSMRASDDLPEPLGPMMPSPLPRSSVRLTSCTTTFWVPGATTAAFSTARVLVGALQRHRRGLRRQQREQLVEPLPALPGGDKALPVGDRQIDRRQRAARLGSSRR